MKKIKTIEQVNGTVALEIRKSLGLTQPEFWGAIGATQSTGTRIEKRRPFSMDEPLRTMFFMRYVMGLDFDATTPAGVRKLARLVELQKLDQASQGA